MSNLPTCPCDNPEVIANTAGGNDFYFCRGCKQEVEVIEEMESEEPFFGILTDNIFGIVSGSTGASGLPLAGPAMTNPSTGTNTVAKTHAWDYTTNICKDCGQTYFQYQNMLRNNNISICNPTPTPQVPLNAPSVSINFPPSHILQQLQGHRWNAVLNRCLDCGITATEYVQQGYQVCQKASTSALAGGSTMPIKYLCVHNYNTQGVCMHCNTTLPLYFIP